MMNSKNLLHELIKDIGFLESCVSFSSQHDPEKELFVSTATLNLDDKVIIEGTGKGQKKTRAEIAASQHIIEIIHEDHTDLLIDWDDVFKEAQIGDVLIKLQAYLSADTTTAADNSYWLQTHETDKYLVRVFDRLKDQAHASVSLFGPNLGAKKKATWIEAMIWRQFGVQILSPTADQAFRELKTFLTQ